MAKIAFSAMVDAASGKMGTVVWTEARNGHTSRVWRRVRNPRTPDQTFVRSNLARASRAFAAMTPAQAQAWNNYGQTITHVNPINGKTYHPAGIDIFVALTTKFLQNNPAGTIPLSPPAAPFLGDSITLIADSETPGELLFTASGPNAAGVTTELLIQKLAGRNRVPNPNGYNSAAFNVFTTGAGLLKTVEVDAGHYAVAYRFVEIATGQATNPVALGITTVALSMVEGGRSDAAAFESAKPAKALKKAA